MRRVLLATLAVATFAWGVCSVQGQRGRNEERFAGQNGWLDSLQAGLRKAQQTGNPLMVVIRCVP